MTLLLCIPFMVANRVSHPPSMLSSTHSASQSIIGYPASNPTNQPTSQPASQPTSQSIADAHGGGDGGGGGGGIGEVGVDGGGFGGGGGSVGFVKKIVVMVSRKCSFLHYHQIRGQTPNEGRRQGRSKRWWRPDGYHGYFKWEGFLTDS